MKRTLLTKLLFYFVLMWCNATTANILKNDAILLFEDSLATLSFKEVQ